MKLHILKIRDCYLSDVIHGYKNFELRKNDRDYQVGDLIHFVDIDGIEFNSFKSNLFIIKYILKNVPQYGLDNDYVILSIEILND